MVGFVNSLLSFSKSNLTHTTSFIICVLWIFKGCKVYGFFTNRTLVLCARLVLGMTATVPAPSEVIEKEPKTAT